MSAFLRIKLDDARRIAGIIWRENLARPRQQTGEGGRYHTFNEWHLGDNLVHLHFLRRLAVEHPDCEFVHACRAEYHEQLKPVVWPLANMKIAPLKGRNPNGIDAWRNHGAWSPRGAYGNQSPLRLDWVEFIWCSWPIWRGGWGCRHPSIPERISCSITR